MSVWKKFWQNLRSRFRRGAGVAAPAADSAGREAERPRQIHAAQAAGRQSGVKQELAALQRSQQQLAMQVSGLQGELSQAVGHEEQLRAEQQRRLDEVRAELETANEQVVSLRASLAESVERQERADARVGTLETRLREQREAFESTLQQQLMRERALGRRLNLALAVAVAAFLLGCTVGAFNYREVRNTNRLLAEVSEGIRDIKLSMAEHLRMPAPLPSPAPPSRSEPGAAADAKRQAPASDSVTPAVPAAGTEPAVTIEIPAPDFVTSGSLPLAGHTFGSRADTRAFFAENAQQPGVVALPEGLQYRVLIPGTGRIPVAGDRVVVEYRSFRPDGTETDNSFRADQARDMAVDEALPGLREALLHMQEGAQWELYIPPALASAGTRKRGLYGFEPLIMTVDLISIITPDARNAPQDEPTPGE